MFIFVLSLFFTLLASAVLWGCLPSMLRKYYWIFGVLAVGVHALWAFMRWNGGTLWMSVPVSTVMVLWCVTMALLASIGLLFLVTRWVYSKAFGKPAAINKERRVLLSAAPVVTISVVASSVAAAGVVNAGKPFKVRHEEIVLKDLPQALDGFRIGQLSDVHVANFITPAYLRSAVAALDEEAVDLQVMTGDLVDDLEQIDATFEALQQCRARHGMVCILGNHEKRRGHLAPIMAAYVRYSELGRLTLLVDQSMSLTHEGASLTVVGVDYPMSAGGNFMPSKESLFQLMRVSAETAFAGTAGGGPLLCLTHHPDFFRFAAEHGAGLTLAGHTHGGQWRVRGVSLANELFDYPLGRYQLGDAHLYVSGGTGHLLPFRMGVPTEVTVLTLRRA